MQLAELWGSASAVRVPVVPDHLQLSLPSHLCMPGD